MPVQTQGGFLICPAEPQFRSAGAGWTDERDQRGAGVDPTAVVTDRSRCTVTDRCCEAGAVPDHGRRRRRYRRKLMASRNHADGSRLVRRRRPEPGDLPVSAADCIWWCRHRSGCGGCSRPSKQAFRVADCRLCIPPRPTPVGHPSSTGGRARRLRPPLRATFTAGHAWTSPGPKVGEAWRPGGPAGDRETFFVRTGMRLVDLWLAGGPPGSPQAQDRRPSRPDRDLLRVYPLGQADPPVQDKLNTQTPASLYKAFPSAEAKRRAKSTGLHPHPRQLPEHGRDGAGLRANAYSSGVRRSKVPPARIPHRIPHRRSWSHHLGDARGLPLDVRNRRTTRLVFRT